MNRFENKVVVITGAAGGIGEATTRRIVSEGGKVVIADHSNEKAEQLAAELTQSGADVRPIYFSATELQSCKELIDFAMKAYTFSCAGDKPYSKTLRCINVYPFEKSHTASSLR